MKNLDKILSEAAEGQTITLESGIYTTMGVTHEQGKTLTGPVLKRGVKLLGHQDGTTILCIRDGTGDEVTVVWGAGENHLVGLTIDCGPKGVATNKRNGVYLYGKSNLVGAVTVLRPWGDYGNQRESFAISCLADQGNGSKITSCDVREIQGDYQTAIQGHHVEDCDVEFPRAQIGTGINFRVAYNVGASKGAVIRNCRSRWASSAVYTDYLDTIDLTVEGCTFFGCRNGLHLNAQQTQGQTETRTIRGVVFRDNTVLLDNTAPQVQAVLLDHSTPSGRYTQDNTLNLIDDVLIERNSFCFLPGRIETPEVLRFASNVASFVKDRSKIGPIGITNVRFLDNHCVDAQLLKWMNWNRLAGVSGEVTKQIEWEE